MIPGRHPRGAWRITDNGAPPRPDPLPPPPTAPRLALRIAAIVALAFAAALGGIHLAARIIPS